MVEVVDASVRQREAEQEQALRSTRGPRYEAAEQLFRPDSSIIGLRKYIEANARVSDPVG